jgi:putative DNA primase/helicase
VSTVTAGILECPKVRDHGLVAVRMSSVRPESVEYAWPGRIAFGKLNLVVGDPGLGKSTVLLDAIARCSRGAPWPDGGVAPLCDSVILSAEDDLGDTVRPRLDALHADVSRIHAITAVRAGDSTRHFSLTDDIARLDALLEQHPELRIVVIDPLSAYLGGNTDSYKDSDVRAILAPLAALAAARRVAIVGIMHLGKGGQRPALYRVLGSIAFTAAARLVLAVAEHPDKDGRRVLAPVKQNICAPSATLAFRLDGGRLTWEGAVEGVDLDNALSGGATDYHERSDAADWLLELLTDDDMMLATDIQRAAKAAGLGWRSVEAAKAQLRVRSVRVGSTGGSGRWVWRLPAKAASPVSLAVLRPYGLNEISNNSTNTATPQDRREMESAALSEGVGDVSRL